MSGFFRLYITSCVDHLSPGDARRYSGFEKVVQATACRPLINAFCPQPVNIPAADGDYPGRLSANTVLIRNRNRKTVLALCRDCGTGPVTMDGEDGTFSTEPCAPEQSIGRGCEWITSGVDRMRRVPTGQHAELPGQDFLAGLKIVPEEWNLCR